MDLITSGSCLLLLLVTSNLQLCQGNVCLSCCPDVFDLPLKSLSDVFMHASRLAQDLLHNSRKIFTEFDLQYAQGKEYYVKATKSCHTKSLETPEDREKAKGKNNEDLSKWILILLYSWQKPLTHLVKDLQTMKEVSDAILSSSREIVKKSRRLELLIERHFSQIIFPADQKMYEAHVFWSDLPSLTSSDEETRLSAFYTLFHCLQTDMHKIDTYAKILACRITQTC